MHSATIATAFLTAAAFVRPMERVSTMDPVKAQSVYDSFAVRLVYETPLDVDYEARFYILTHTNCPAVLAECWFYDNIEECCWLLKENTKYGIAMGFYWAIRDYLAR